MGISSNFNSMGCPPLLSFKDETWKHFSAQKNKGRESHPALNPYKAKNREDVGHLKEQKRRQ